MVGIIGLGNEGFALYSYLANHKIPLVAYTTNPTNLSIKRINSRGKVEGSFELNVSQDLREILKQEIIFITTVTTVYEDIANKIVQVREIDLSKKMFVLFSGKLGGVLVFNKILKNNGINTTIVETDAIFAARKIYDDTVWIRGIKKWNLMITNLDYWGSNKSLEVYDIVRELLPDINLEIADNFIQRGLNDFGAMAHATISLVNLSNIDSKRDMLFYIDGVTENTVILIDKVYQEFNQVAKKFSTYVLHPIELLDRYYGTDKTNLYRAIKGVSNYKYTRMPDSIHNRFLYEDVLNTLFPLTLLAKTVNVEVPICQSIVNIMCSLLSIDPFVKGRTLQKMGLEELPKV
ncbi:MAG: NAD/NADP octopine/nopaline dehydrogenase family protein [bacterium]